MKNHRIKYTLALLVSFVFFFLPVVSAINYESGVLIDDLEQRIELGSVDRVISLEPSITEAIYLAGHFDKLVGVARSARSANWPAAVEQLESVGTIRHVNIEKAVDLDPDLVLGSGMSREGLELLAKLGYQTAYIDPKNITDIWNNMIELGELLGDSEQAQAQVAEYKLTVEEIKDQIRVGEQKTAFFLYNINPVMAMGRDTIPNQVLELAGAKNLALDITEDGNPSFSLERLLELDPDFIFLAMRAVSAVEELKNDPVWSQLTAVKNNNVHLPPTEYILRPTPRVIYGIKEINQLVYP